MQNKQKEQLQILSDYIMDWELHLPSIHNTYMYVWSDSVYWIWNRVCDRIAHLVEAIILHSFGEEKSDY